ncbi:MAG TPA: polysaccharide biosynthesis C-terminal domain-containing protein, partial [Candidatus Nitrosotenuis sp.]|nr:polysaccharide biosynthesis C-terminal domain-containing protein [Candidatus Nitrosotenuis sp.]
QNACRQSVRMLSLLGLPLAVGTTILAPRIVDWLYGAAYAQSAVYLQILIWAVALIFWNATLPAALNATGHERDSLVVVAAGLAFNIAGNVLLIPRWGALAAAWMTLFTEIVSTLLYLHFFGRRLFPPQFFFLLARPVVAAAVMAAALAWIPTGALSAHPGLIVTLLGLLGAALYAGVLLALGEIRRRDWQLWRDALGLGRKAALEPS